MFGFDVCDGGDQTRAASGASAGTAGSNPAGSIGSHHQTFFLCVLTLLLIAMLCYAKTGYTMFTRFTRGVQMEVRCRFSSFPGIMSSVLAPRTSSFDEAINVTNGQKIGMNLFGVSCMLTLPAKNVTR